MKILLIVVFCLLSYGHNCYSIPQNFGGNLFGATFLPQKIANDFTEKLIFVFKYYSVKNVSFLFSDLIVTSFFQNWF